MLIAAAHIALASTVDLFPDINEGSLVATIRFHKNSTDESSLYPFISKRCTNRKRYVKKPISPHVMKSLIETPIINGARLHVITQKSEIKKIRCLAARIDAIIFHHPLLHGGLFKWIRWNKDDILKTRDGLPVDSLELAPPEKIMFRLMSFWPAMKFMNKFGINKLIGQANSSLLLHSSAVCIITMNNSNRNDYINGGRYFERLWLKATSLGLSLQPFGGLSALLTRVQKANNEGFSSKQYNTLLSVFDDLRKICPITENNALIIAFRIGMATEPSVRTIRRTIPEFVK